MGRVSRHATDFRGPYGSRRGGLAFLAGVDSDRAGSQWPRGAASVKRTPCSRRRLTRSGDPFTLPSPERRAASSETARHASIASDDASTLAQTLEDATDRDGSRHRRRLIRPEQHLADEAGPAVIDGQAQSSVPRPADGRRRVGRRAFPTRKEPSPPARPASRHLAAKA